MAPRTRRPAAARRPARRRRRWCHGTTKKGTRCESPPLKRGTVIEGIKVSGRWCRTHDRDLPDSARNQRAQPGAGRPRVERPTERARRLVEENIEKVLAPYWRTLGFDIVRDEGGELTLVARPEGGAKLHGESREGIVRVS